MTNNKQPTISIIMPVYNAGDFLVECVESILNQTFKDWELIAVDDGSTDNSYPILKDFSHKDKRIRLFKNPKNLGVAATLNVAIKHAQGSKLARMDADDIMLPHRLERQLKFLKSHPKTVVVGGQCELINLNGQTIGNKHYPQTDNEIRKMIFIFSPASHPSIMINRKLVPNNFTWYNQSVCPAEDIDLYFRLFEYGKFANLNYSVTKYRLYPSSTSFKNPKLNFLKTTGVRQAAIDSGFRPGKRGRFVHGLEKLVISIVPADFIYPLYVFIRGLTEVKWTLSVNWTRLTQKLVFDLDLS